MYGVCESFTGDVRSSELSVDTAVDVACIIQIGESCGFRGRRTDN
jgi:hypothetical protein